MDESSLVNNQAIVAQTDVELAAEIKRQENRSFGRRSPRDQQVELVNVSFKTFDGPKEQHSVSARA